MTQPNEKIEEGIYNYEAALAEALLYGGLQQTPVAPKMMPAPTPAPRFRAA